MRKLALLVTISCIILYSCKNKNDITNNPLLNESTNIYKIPDFDNITPLHYLQALKYRIKKQQSVITEITDNSEKIDFHNIIIPLDNSFKLIEDIYNIYYGLSWVKRDSALNSINDTINSLINKNRDDIYLNTELFIKIKNLFLDKNNLNLNKEQKRVVQKYYQDFVRNGGSLDYKDKNRLREINNNLNSLLLKFEENYFAETNSNYRLVIHNKEDLKGLSNEIISNAAHLAKNYKLENCYVFNLHRSSIIPFLTYSDNRELREDIYKAFVNRGNNKNEFDNNEIFLEIVKLRAEKAKILGFESYADYIISNNMAKNKENVCDLLIDILEPAIKMADKELEEMQEYVFKEKSKIIIAPWDWLYYAEKLKAEKFNNLNTDFTEYLSLDNVQNGMFDVANKLYGISISEIHMLPKYHMDTKVFEVKDKEGTKIGILMTDYYERPDKFNGAWSMELKRGLKSSDSRSYPVVVIVSNFLLPTNDSILLLTLEEVNILFHEFGHALHSLFSAGNYYKTAGRLPADMNELPSKIMENWATYPDVLKSYAKHYKSLEPISDSLIDIIQVSLKSSQAYETIEYISAALLDIYWHSISENEQINVNEFEQNILERLKIPKEISPRARAPYFYQIIAGGYDSNLYDYLWSEVLDADAFQAFVESGDLFNKDIANKFRKYILSEGGNDDAELQYYKFRNKKPTIENYLKEKGILY